MGSAWRYCCNWCCILSGARHYHIGFEPFWAGLFLLTGIHLSGGGSGARAWILLGWAIPFLAYGSLSAAGGGPSQSEWRLVGNDVSSRWRCRFPSSRSCKSGRSNAKMNPIDFNGLDTAVHGPIRLGIMTALQMDGAARFHDLEETAGNRGRQFEPASGQTGADAAISPSKKAFVALRPKTTYRITPTGRKALTNYLAEHEKPD